MQECLQKWLDSQLMYFHNLGEHYHHLLTQQASNRWEQLFYRQFVKTWCTCQDEHVQNSNAKHVKTTGEMWLIGLIKIIWNHVHENWESCNEAAKLRSHNEKP